MAESASKQNPAQQALPDQSEQAPLLPSHRQHIARPSDANEAADHVIEAEEKENFIPRLRRFLRWLLPSKYGHYFVIIVVSLDITCIFADFLISLHVCEHGGEKGFNAKGWLTAKDVMAAFGLLFSTLFMVELLASLFAFGLSYLRSPFHILDATVIIASFVVDVALRGGLEEAGSLIVVLRLWRVFKIIEEFSTGAEDQMGQLQEYIDKLQREKQDVVRENQTLKHRVETFEAGT